MPLIFAVDSDKRQSAHLASLLRSHVDADLVQSATALDGIGALQGLIPDLVLTSSLLSPRDESALANHMRDLGVRAGHVHTLTIPVLATARKTSKKRPSGVLGALRREKSGEVEAAGCQPEVFAKEVRIYLERAVAERVGMGDLTDIGASTELPDPVVTDAVAEIEDEAIVEPEAFAQAPEPEIVAEALAPPEARVPVVDMSTFDDLDALAAQLAAPSDARLPAEVPASDPFEQFFVPLAQGPGDPTPEPLAAAVEPEPVEIPAVSSDTWFDRMTAAVRQEAPVKPAPPPAPEPVFSWIDNQTVSSLSDVLSRVRASDSDAQQPVAVTREPVVSKPESVPEPVATPPPEPAPTPLAATARPEVLVDLVPPPAAPFLDPDVLALFGAAAHRAGLDALESLSRPTPTVGDKALPPLPSPGPERPPRPARESKAERRSRRKAPRPLADEWGMYDPTQCGPAALFDEDAWNEVETEEKVPTRRPRAS